jgi:DC-STAMP-like protein
LLFFEPFGLRLRTVIMGYHYPEVETERTRWLYHHILRKRRDFLWLKLAKMKTRTTMKGEHRTLLDCFRLQWLFKSKADYFCVLCMVSVMRFVSHLRLLSPFG